MRRTVLRFFTTAAAVGLMATVTACGSSSPTASPATTSSTTRAVSKLKGPCGTLTTPPRYRHVVWIWMENHQWNQVLGDPSDAPVETSLAKLCGTATNYSSVGSPSLPNYIGATSGGTQGITDDNGPSDHVLTVSNIFRQVRAAGGTERSYEESMPHNCQLTSTSLYAPKHNPAAYYTGNNDRQACQRDDVPLLSFYADLVNGNLPTFSFITPNLCDDTHDCGVSSGDRWLGAFIPRLLNSPVYRAQRTAVFIVWDETTPMPTIFISPSTRPGTVSKLAFNHYSLLRTTEEMLHLPLLGAAATARSLRGPFNL